MGFNEDDRIRMKNAVHNAAYSIFMSRVYAYHSASDIINEAENELVKDVNRADVWNEVIKLAKGKADVVRPA